MANFNTGFPLLRWLRCPFCGGNFNVSDTTRITDEPAYNVLTCYCGQYPVVAGIPILKKGVIGSDGQHANEVIALIKAGKHLEALFSLLSPPSPMLAPDWMNALPRVRGIPR